MFIFFSGTMLSIWLIPNYNSDARVQYITYLIEVCYSVKLFYHHLWLQIPVKPLLVATYPTKVIQYLRIMFNKKLINVIKTKL